MKVVARKRAHVGNCPVSGKVRFRDHREAVAVLHSAARARLSGYPTRRAECRAYECSACRGWHLTSRA